MLTTKNPTFPIIITVQFLFGITKFILHPTDIYTLLSLAVGAIGIILYYKGHRKHDVFFYVWVFMQVPRVFLLTKAGIEVPITDAFPAVAFPLNLGAGLSLTLTNGDQLTIYANALPVALYFLLKYINVDTALNSEISISRLRKGSFPQAQFPMEGIVEKIVGREKMTAIYKVQLDHELHIKDKNYTHICLEPKNNNAIHFTNKKQVCGLRLCAQPDLPYSNSKYPFVDWVIIQCQ